MENLGYQISEEISRAAFEKKFGRKQAQAWSKIDFAALPEAWFASIGELQIDAGETRQGITQFSDGSVFPEGEAPWMDRMDFIDEIIQRGCKDEKLIEWLMN